MTRIPEPVGPDACEFLTHRKLLNKSFLSPAQRGIVKAIYGLHMTSEEAQVMADLLEGVPLNPKGYDEAAIICGRRSGKTVLAAGIGTHETVKWGPFLRDHLDAGEVAEGILIAQTDKDANKAKNYIKGNFQTLKDNGNDFLAKTEGQERAITGSAIKTCWPLEIVIYPATKEGSRGATALWALLDEIAYWKTAEGAYSQDEGVVEAVEPTLATLAAMRPKLIMISSPRKKEGVLYKAYKGREKSEMLVVRAPTWVMNPKIERDNPKFFIRKQAKNPESYIREWAAEFSDEADGTLFIPPAVIEACVNAGRIQTPRQPGIDYLAWIDAGFKRDRFSLGIGHLIAAIGAEGNDRAHIDRMRHWTPEPMAKGRKARPLDPDVVVDEVVEELRYYGIDTVHGDQFADVPLAKAFEKRGIRFIESPVSMPEKMEAFKNTRAAMRVKLVDLPDDPETISDFKGLLKKETSGGHLQIGAPKRKGSYDDAANVVARIVNKLLPLNSAVDTSKWNDQAMPERLPGQDWREATPVDEMRGGLMEAVY